MMRKGGVFCSAYDSGLARFAVSRFDSTGPPTSFVTAAIMMAGYSLVIDSNSLDGYFVKSVGPLTSHTAWTQLETFSSAPLSKAGSPPVVPNKAARCAPADPPQTPK